LSGWPISYNDLIPYYAQALDVCEVDTGGLGLQAFDKNFKKSSQLASQSEKFINKNFFFSPPTRFGKRYKKELEQAKNINCYLNATVTTITGSNGEISQLSGVSSAGKPFSIEASTYVLATGAIENARLLLTNKLANSSDFVGRCFSDHNGEMVAAAVLDGNNKYFNHDIQINSRKGQLLPEKTLIMPHLSFADDIIIENKLINFGIAIELSYRVGSTSDSVMSLRHFETGKKVDLFNILVRMENTPNPNSTIKLINSRDIYGMPRIKLDWQPNRYDFESLLKIRDIFSKEVLNRNIGRVQWKQVDPSQLQQSASIQPHHLGTTRMSDNPELGVVDENLRCHDHSNLYIVGSSCFPSFGFASATLTIVALALRLGDKLSTN
jgi:choline dehydrogenase-like flavoprotein